jgi:hypothetical protein
MPALCVGDQKEERMNRSTKTMLAVGALFLVLLGLVAWLLSRLPPGTIGTAAVVLSAVGTLVMAGLIGLQSIRLQEQAVHMAEQAEHMKESVAAMKDQAKVMEASVAATRGLAWEQARSRNAQLFLKVQELVKARVLSKKDLRECVKNIGVENLYDKEKRDWQPSIRDQILVWDLIGYLCMNGLLEIKLVVDYYADPIYRLWYLVEEKTTHFNRYRKDIGDDSKYEPFKTLALAAKDALGLRTAIIMLEIL